MLLHEYNWKQEVLQAGGPVLVDCWASWCPPCRAMNPVVEALARDFKVCKVNVDTNQELAARYGISSIPAPSTRSRFKPCGTSTPGSRWSDSRSGWGCPVGIPFRSIPFHSVPRVRIRSTEAPTWNGTERIAPRAGHARGTRRPDSTYRTV